MFTKVKSWLSRRFATEAVLEQNMKLLELLEKQRNLVISLEDSMVALDNKLCSELIATYQIIGALILREENSKIIVSNALLQAAANTPTITFNQDKDSDNCVIEFAPMKEDNENVN